MVKAARSFGAGPEKSGPVGVVRRVKSLAAPLRKARKARKAAALSPWRRMLMEKRAQMSMLPPKKKAL